MGGAGAFFGGKDLDALDGYVRDGLMDGVCMTLAFWKGIDMA